jgi:hypothetical protein
MNKLTVFYICNIHAIYETIYMKYIENYMQRKVYLDYGVLYIL